MTNTEIRRLLTFAILPKTLCRLRTYYMDDWRYYLPLTTSQTLLCASEEENFRFNGYTVLPFADIDEAEESGGLYSRILSAEHVLDELALPPIDITSWRTLFDSVDALNENVIVEGEDPDPDMSLFAIGRVEKVCASCVYLRHFDAEGVWEKEPWRIMYDEITGVTLRSRYAELMSKYLPPLPQDYRKGV